MGGDGAVNFLRMRIAVSSSVREFGRENFLQVEFRVAVLFWCDSLCVSLSLAELATGECA